MQDEKEDTERERERDERGTGGGGMGVKSGRFSCGLPRGAGLWGDGDSLTGPTAGLNGNQVHAALHNSLPTGGGQ